MHLPVVGTWIVTAQATDDNNNGIMDAAEVVSMTADTVQSHLLYKFLADGTFEMSYYASSNLVGTWAYEYDNTWLKVTTNSMQPSHSKIETLTATTLTIKDTSGGQASWGTFTRQ